MLYQVGEFNNFTLQALDGEIGRLKDILFDDRNVVLRYLVVDTNKWLPGGRKVVISPISVGEPDIENKKLPVCLSKKDIEDSPHLDENKPVSREYETNFFDYFGYGYYWMGQSLWGPYPTPASLAGIEAERNAESDAVVLQSKEGHLRSVNEVDGYRIRTQDGKVGQVADFIVDTEDWRLPYLVVDTNTLLPFGKKVLVPANYLDAVSWVDRTVEVELTTSQISESPEFEIKKLQSKRYRDTLDAYYDFLNLKKKANG